MEGEVAHYSCEEGYVLHGGDMRYCQMDGGWSGTPPVCVGEWCDRALLLSNVDQGELDLWRNFGKLF